MDVSINICTKNRAVECAILLSSLIRQTHQNFEVVLVDGSEQPSMNYKFFSDIMNRLKLSHKVKLVQDIYRTGPCKARNVAVENSTYEHIVRIDDDSFCEPDYLERLVTLWEIMEKEGIKVGAVGGIVPLLGAPDVMRDSDTRENRFIFNEVRFDRDGNITLEDCGGNHWLGSNRIWEAHHLRSSFMFSKKAWKDAGGFPEQLGSVGFREETWFCLAMAWKGYKMYTDLDAIAWHQFCQGGGVRSQDYVGGVQLGEHAFREWAKRMFEQCGNPFEAKK